MSKSIQCPKCGSEMIKRQARQGRNTGGYFYGCSRFPNCKGIINISDGSSETSSQPSHPPIDTRPYVDISSLKFPIYLSARPRAPGLSTIFFDSLAVPDNLLVAISNENINRDSMSNLSKWRADFTPDQSTLDNKSSSIISILNKIVNRGSITRLSSSLEYDILSASNITDRMEYEWHATRKTYKTTYTPNIPQQWHDGEKHANLKGMTAEEYFYKNILLKTIGTENASDVLPQVLFKSLILISKDPLGSSVLNQRVDFLLTHNSRSIVIEIDDPTHSNHTQRDDTRDKVLEDNGLEVYRVDVKELEHNKGPTLNKLVNKLSELYSKDNASEMNYPELQAIKIAHNFQLLILGLLKEGKIKPAEDTRVYFDPNNTPSIQPRELYRVLGAALKDLRELDHNIARLYSSSPLLSKVSLAIEHPDLVISVNDNPTYSQKKMVYIQDINYPLPLAQNYQETIDYIRPTTDEQILKFLLEYIFRFENFRPNQIDGIQRTLQGEDSIILLPTGSGKSIIYQLLALIMPGMAVVIDPLVSLIEDQVDNLRRAGIDRVIGINATTDNKDKVQQAIAQGLYIMTYASPERFQIEGFRNSLSAYSSNKTVSVCAIDEAHCVSEWGHDFRTSYLNLAQTCRKILKSGLRTPPVLALTGTASESVLRDMQRDLRIDESAVIRPSSFDRKEIEFLIFPSSSSQKNDTLRDILEHDLPKRFNSTASDFYLPKGRDTNSGIVFCMHVGGDFGVKQVMRNINSLGIESKDYFGQQTRSSRTMTDEEWSKAKRHHAVEFKNNRFPVLTSTKSFGMGVDKPNVRFTIHYGLPQSIESYYQEAGRAGRDRKRAYSYIIVSNDNPARNSTLLSPVSTLEDVARSDKERKKGEGDDISRALWFHTNSFSGIDKELQNTIKTLEIIGDLDQNKQVNITSNYDSREGIEKAIYRLLILGVVSDYTVNFASSEFQVQVNQFKPETIVNHYGEYVRGYQDDDDFVATAREKVRSINSDSPQNFIVKAMELLLEDFIYKVIENSRRRAFSNLVSITDEASKIPDHLERSKLMRRRILEFLGNTHVDIIKTITDNPGDLDQINNLLKPIRGSKAASLYAEVSRTLQAYPDHPGLLSAHLALQLRLKDYDIQAVQSNLFAILKYSLSVYSIKASTTTSNLSWLLSLMRPEDYDATLIGIVEKVDNSGFNKLLTTHLPEDKKYIPRIYEYSTITSNIVNEIGKEELWKPMN